MTTHSLRRTLKQRRRQIPPDQRTLLNARLTSHIQQLPVFRRAQHIAGYVACGGEADPLALLRLAQRQRKQCYLPVLHPFLPRKLLFAPWTTTTPMRHNRFGIPEPVYSVAHCIQPALLNLVLTPLLGFDHQAHRLGMGGGFYDRTFAFRRWRQHWHQPCLLGMAFTEQQCPTLPQYPWDVALDLVVTPEAIFPK